MKRIYIIIGVALLLFASCGRQQQAKSSVKDFVEQQLHRDVSYLDFSSVDSTRAITDSLIQTLRNRAGQGVQYLVRRCSTSEHSICRMKIRSVPPSISTLRRWVL